MQNSRNSSFICLRNGSYVFTGLFLESLFDQDRNKMFWPIFARGPWPETFKASFSRTNQTANERGRQKKCVKILLNFTYLHKTQPGQKTAGNSEFFLRYLLTRCLGIQVWMSVYSRLAICLRHFKSGDKTSR